jgi:hypothetical protein
VPWSKLRDARSWPVRLRLKTCPSGCSRKALALSTREKRGLYRRLAAAFAAAVTAVQDALTKMGL